HSIPSRALASRWPASRRPPATWASAISVCAAAARPTTSGRWPRPSAAPCWPAATRPTSRCTRSSATSPRRPSATAAGGTTKRDKAPVGGAPGRRPHPARLPADLDGRHSVAHQGGRRRIRPYRNDTLSAVSHTSEAASRLLRGGDRRVGGAGRRPPPVVRDVRKAVRSPRLAFARHGRACRGPHRTKHRTEKRVPARSVVRAREPSLPRPLDGWCAPLLAAVRTEGDDRRLGAPLAPTPEQSRRSANPGRQLRHTVVVTQAVAWSAPSCRSASGTQRGKPLGSYHIDRKFLRAYCASRRRTSQPSARQSTLSASATCDFYGMGRGSRFGSVAAYRCRRLSVAIQTREMTSPTMPTAIRMSPTMCQLTDAPARFERRLTANRRIAPTAMRTIDAP